MLGATGGLTDASVTSGAVLVGVGAGVGLVGVGLVVVGGVAGPLTGAAQGPKVAGRGFIDNFGFVWRNSSRPPKLNDEERTIDQINLRNI